MSLPPMQWDGGRWLVRRDVALWIGGVCAGWSAVARLSAISDTFTSVAELVELESMMVADGN